MSGAAICLFEQLSLKLEFLGILGKGNHVWLVGNSYRESDELLRRLWTEKQYTLNLAVLPFVLDERRAQSMRDQGENTLLLMTLGKLSVNIHSSHRCTKKCGK